MHAAARLHFATIVLTLCVTGAMADEPAASAAGPGASSEIGKIGEPAPASPSKLTVDIELGVLRGRAREFVFNPNPNAGGATLSRLDWDLDHVAMVGVVLAYRPRDWWQLKVGGATNRSNGADLVDYDFNIFFCPPAASAGTLCKSTHHDTQLERALSFDAELAVRLLRFRGGELLGRVGYKWRAFDWRGYGGDANYAGALPPGAGISYQQRWDTPYLGVRWWRDFGAFEVGLEGSGSAWASAHARDHHHLRSLVFTERFRDVGTFALGAELGYQFRHNIRLSLRYEFERWLLARGDTRVVDLFDGSERSFAGVAGVSLYTQSLSLGVSIALDRVPDAGSASATPPDIWRGSYAGFVAGPIRSQAGWRTRSLSQPAFAPEAATRAANFDSTAAYAGAFVGHGVRWHSWLMGGEVDFGRADANDYVSGIAGTGTAESLPASPDVTVVGSRWDSSLRLRAGRNLGADILAYVTGGVAVQHLRYRVSCHLDGPWCVSDREAKFNTNRAGWTLGAGLETAFAQGWFARAEYRYADAGRFAHDFFSATPEDRVATRLGASSHRLLLGIGLRF